MRFLYHTIYDPFCALEDICVLNLNRVIIFLSVCLIASDLGSTLTNPVPPNHWIAFWGTMLFLILVKLWGEPKPKRKNDE